MKEAKETEDKMKYMQSVYRREIDVLHNVSSRNDEQHKLTLKVLEDRNEDIQREITEKNKKVCNEMK